MDLIIKNGKILDGSGNIWYRGDVGIEGDSIAALGDLSGAEAQEVIDAEGKYVAPGFIDMHSHSDSNLVVNPEAHSKIRQGVTTEVIGQCGHSAAPLMGEARERAEEQAERWGLEIDWETMGDYMDRLQREGVSVNVVPLVGHGNLRRIVMGYENREPTEDEMEQMVDLLEEGMEAGAFGMSSGLIYAPGSYSDTDELVHLAKGLRPYNGTYFTHMRNEGNRLLDALEEAFTISREAGIPAQISHHKAVGKPNWGKVKKSLAAIEQVREDGLDVTCDQYPYIATSTSLSASMPKWAHEGGKEALLERLQDPETREKIYEEIDPQKKEAGGWDTLVISRVSSEENKHYEGMNLEEIAAERGVEACYAAFDLLVEEELQVGVVNFCLNEDDVRYVMQHPTVMPGSDGSALVTEGPLGEGKPHPRSYGTFVRILGKYVREEGVLTFPEAVRKMTSLPAQKLGLTDRGLLKKGLKADIVVFDADTVEDKATFVEPHQYAAGVEEVIVNGRRVITEGDHTGARPGSVLKKN